MNTHAKISQGATDLSRRSFLISSGVAGLMFGFGTATASAAAATAYDPSIWYSMGANGLVTVNVGKADMGQHIASTMAQIVAEELGASWSDMRVNLIGNDAKYADPVLGAIITGGSWSTMMNFETMSRAGAAGRLALIEAGAAMLGVPAGECVAKDSRIKHTKSGKSVTYAEIVKSGKVTKSYTADELKALKLKTPDQYTLIGKELPQLDIPLKVNGKAKYGIDTVLPGMLYGRIITPPVRYGSKVTNVDDSAADGELAGQFHRRRADQPVLDEPPGQLLDRHRAADAKPPRLPVERFAAGQRLQQTLDAAHNELGTVKGDRRILPERPGWLWSLYTGIRVIIWHAQSG